MNTKELEKIFKIYASKRRLDIINLLIKKKTASLNEIAREIKLSIKSTSKHLRILYSVGLLEREYKGLEIQYKLADVKDKFIKNILNLIGNQ
jgi:DNA-binding transcriptional ArsR family regulator